MSASSSPSRQKPRIAVARLIAHTWSNNRENYLVVAHDGVLRQHGRFLADVVRHIPKAGLPRAKLRNVVDRLGGGYYRLYYNSIVVKDAASARKRLF